MTKEGKWGKPIPPAAQRVLDELKNKPDVDWMHSGEWFVARLYDDSDSGTLVVARTLYEEDWGAV